MFGIGYSELLLIAVIGLVVIGPKDLPRVMRQVGQWIGRAQAMARHFRSGIDTMIREAELEDMEKTWRDENERIMRDNPLLNPGAAMMPLDPPKPAAEAAWEPQPATAEAPDQPPAPPPATPDPNAPELPLGPPPAPDRELP